MAINWNAVTKAVGADRANKARGIMTGGGTGATTSGSSTGSSGGTSGGSPSVVGGTGTTSRGSTTVGTSSGSTGSPINRTAPTSASRPYNPATASVDEVRSRILAYRAANPTTPTQQKEQPKTPPIDRTPAIDPKYSGFMDYFQDPLKAYNESRKEAERQMQRRIDDINVRYDSQVRAEREAGDQDLARMRSMNLRAGLGGSDFGAANKGEVRNRTNANVATIDANRDIAIGDAINQIETLANQRAQLQQQAMYQGFTANMQYDTYLQEMKTSSLETLKSLGESGLDIETIKKRDPKLYEELIVATGLGEVQAEAVMNKARTDAQKIDYTYQVVGNKVIGYGLDPVTGTIKQVSQELDFEVPKNYSATFAPDGTMMLVPDSWDPNLPVESQVKFVGNFAKPETGGGSGVGSGGLGGFDSMESLMSDPVVTGYVDMLRSGATTLSAIPEEYRSAVSIAFANDTSTSNGVDTALSTLDLVQSAAASALELAGASGTGAISRTVGDWTIGDTNYRRLEAYTNTLKTNMLTMMTDPTIRKFFGPQMSNADVALMNSAATTLDPSKNSPADYVAEIKRMQSIFNRMQEFANSERGIDTEAIDAQKAAVGDVVTLNGVSYIKLGENNYEPASNYMSLRPSN